VVVFSTAPYTGHAATCPTSYCKLAFAPIPNPLLVEGAALEA
jgi:hypothetical protein